MPLNKRIRSFYSDRGWRMFDAAALTPAVRDLLDAERQLVERLLGLPGAVFTRLVELGCGYGRLAPLASRCGLPYDGFDLVDWLLDLGRLRQHGRRDAVRLHHCAGEALRSVLPRAAGALAVLPFNLLGNVANPARLVRELRASGAHILVCGFDTDVAATEARRAYYENCGYRVAPVLHDARGVLMTAPEGLHSLALAGPALARLMTEEGYAALHTEALARVGHATLFAPAGEVAAPTSARPQPLERPTWQHPLGGSLDVRALGGSAEEASPLLRFRRYPARSCAWRGNELHLVGAERVPAGLVALHCKRAGVRAGVLRDGNLSGSAWHGVVSLVPAPRSAPAALEVRACAT